MTTEPLKALMETALKNFRKELVKQGVYAEDHENLNRACNGARDFVDYLLDGPKVLSIGRRRPK